MPLVRFQRIDLIIFLGILCFQLVKKNLVVAKSASDKSSLEYLHSQFFLEAGHVSFEWRGVVVKSCWDLLFCFDVA